MTDHSSSQSQPSMEDILASIRRIIDEEDESPATAGSRAQSSVSMGQAAPQTVASGAAESSASVSSLSERVVRSSPETESVFPQRHGRLWRRVAGHPLEDGEADPLPEDDTFELTDLFEDDPSTDLAAKPSGPSLDEFQARDRREPIPAPSIDERDDDDLPPPVFERVDVAPSTGFVAEAGEEEVLLGDPFVPESDGAEEGDYSRALDTRDEDERERELDERFYDADALDDAPPEIEGTYATSLGGEARTTRHEGAPTEDEMETVGGLVRDALRGRLPALPQKSDNTPLVTGNAEESAARSLATLARYDAHAPRRIYGGIKITDDEDSPTIEGMVQDTLRPMLREWLNDNLPTLVENMVKQEVDRISARSRQFVRDE